MNPHREKALEQATRFGQQHLFRYWDELGPPEQQTLLADIARIDFPLVCRLTGSDRTCDPSSPSPDSARIEAAEAFPAEPGPEHRDLYTEAVAQGQSMLRSSKVATMVVAGGQGTRLGFDAPKGTFRISPVKNKPLFQLFAETLIATCRRYRCRVPWYIMTSQATDAATRTFFDESDYFGLDRADVRFFQQGVMPAVDDDGRILLADRHRVALSPNGHGGTLMAMRDNGILDDMRARGIEAVAYFQVDNPLAWPTDPLLLGLHKLTGSEMSSIAVPKADDLERVGNFTKVDGKLQVIEYSDLPDELAHARNPDGSRLLDAGNIAIHVFCPCFVERLTDGCDGSDGLSLPWHLAKKRVPHIDLDTSRRVQPAQPNATKFEQFIFDAIPLASKAMVLVQHRALCFSPVKNATGTDSPETARRDMVARAAAWLEECGIQVPRGDTGRPLATIEVSPLLALDAGQLAQTLTPPVEIRPGQELYLG